MYLLDTNTLICFFKGMGDVAEHLLRVPPKEIAVPSIVLFELETGIAKSTAPSKRRAQLREFVALTQVVPFDEGAARESAAIRADLERRGQPIGPFDLLIAGTALSRKATLVTRNLDEFQRIKKLSLENWY